MPRKPGGKYKGKVGRAKGDATIAAELEAKRRKAYEANLQKLQERRQQELLAEQGLQSAEEEALAHKMAKIAAMFGSGKKGTLTKFWRFWKIGVTQTKKEKALYERQTCWRKSCGFCSALPVQEANRHNKFSFPHMMSCKDWWKHTLGRGDQGEELNPLGAARDRPAIVNDYRQCQCCGTDTGITALGCRGWHGLRDVDFASPAEMAKKQKATRFMDIPTVASSLLSLKGSASSPALRSPRPSTPKMTLCAETNWARLRGDTSHGRVPEYDPTAPFVLSPEQAATEERRAWSDELTAMAGSPSNRRRAGEPLPPMLQFPPLAPPLTDRGATLQQVAHWRTGQKTMLDKHMMKMYVVGVQ
jgi:hypothetical protein